MRHSHSAFRLRESAPVGPHVPLLDSTDLPGDDDTWTLPGEFMSDDLVDDDRFATLSVARAFDD